jgi:hypothetical protein
MAAIDFTKTITIDSGDSAKQKGTKVTLDDVCKANIFVSAAAAFWYKREGNCLVTINTNGRDKICSAPLDISELGMVLRLNAHPSCNRLLDPIPLAFRKHAKNKEWIPGSGKLKLYSMLLTANRHQLCDGMIGVTILHFTGRVRRFADFHLAQEDGFMLPGINMNEINQFLEYMASTMVIKSGRSPSTTEWQSKQHIESIPKNLKKFVAFSSFVRAVASKLFNFVESLYKKKLLSSRGLGRQEVMIELTSFSKGCISGGPVKGNLEFLSHQILADIESAFGRVFGEITAESIVAGHAGNLGYVMSNWYKPKNEQQDLPETLKTIVGIVSDPDKFSNIEIMVLGYKRRECDGVVINPATGHPFSCVNSEHFLCKGWIVIKKTFNHYRNSKYPTPLEPHLHPIKMPDTLQGRTYFSDHYLETCWISQTIEAFRETVCHATEPRKQSYHKCSEQTIQTNLKYTQL